MKFIALIGGRQTQIEAVHVDGQYHLTIGDRSFTVNAIHPNRRSLSMLIDGVSYEVGLEKNKSKYSLYFYNDTIHLEIFDARKFRAAELVKKTVTSGPFQLQAPMPGKIVRVVAQENTHVNEGDSLLVMEAMKMQNEFKAPHAGVVKQIRVREGDAVAAAQVLLILE